MDILTWIIVGLVDLGTHQVEEVLGRIEHGVYS